MNKTLQKKIESWSLGKDNHKLIPEGGEVLKGAGSEMLLIEFTKKEDQWTASDPIPVYVSRIGDYNPMTGTYNLTYNEKDKEAITTQITPEGFSFNQPEEEGWMKRFITYSLHFKTMEEEIYYSRLREKFEKSEGVLGIEQITVLQKSKTYQYHNYISAVIDTDVSGGIGKGILAFRISDISSLFKRSKSWSFGVRDWEGYYVNIPKYQETENGWVCKGFSIDGEVLGDLKIIDIQDPR